MNPKVSTLVIIIILDFQITFLIFMHTVKKKGLTLAHKLSMY